MLFELGLNPLEYEVHYRRLMLYHNLENSSDKRVAKQGFGNKRNITWRIASTVKYSRVLKRFGVMLYLIDSHSRLASYAEFKLLDARQVKKSTWKQQVKKKVKRKVWSIMEDKIEV